jgi:glycerate 2-kinase
MGVNLKGVVQKEPSLLFFERRALMKILIASDSFKGSLSSKQICELGTKAIVSVLPSAEVIGIPLADGGEGTVEALVEGTNGSFRNLNVTGPLGNQVLAIYGILGDGETAVIEMASASGILHVPFNQLDPLVTTSFGTGELILDAVQQGCHRIIMGIGGSATNDGGVGMLQALGFRFLDQEGADIGYGGQFLDKINSIDASQVSEKIKEIDITVACDVNNPLTGRNGATFVYGPQKGGTPEKLEILEKGMINYKKHILDFWGHDIDDYQGSGAAGGMGAGLIAFLGAKTGLGFDIVSNTLQLEKIIEQERFDYIFTGEGQMNDQTLHGKLPYGITRLGVKYGVPVIAIVGSTGKGYEKMLDEGLLAAFSIISSPMDLNEAMENAKKLLYNAYQNVARLLK